MLDRVLFAHVVGHPVLIRLALHAQVFLLIELLARGSGVGDALSSGHVVGGEAAQTNVARFHGFLAVVTVFSESALSLGLIQPEPVDARFAAVLEGRPLLAEKPVVHVANSVVQVVAFGAGQTGVRSHIVLLATNRVGGAGGSEDEVPLLASHADIFVGLVQPAVLDRVRHALAQLVVVAGVAVDALVSTGVGHGAVVDVAVLDAPVFLVLEVSGQTTDTVVRVVTVHVAVLGSVGQALVGGVEVEPGLALEAVVSVRIFQPAVLEHVLFANAVDVFEEALLANLAFVSLGVEHEAILDGVGVALAAGVEEAVFANQTLARLDVGNQTVGGFDSQAQGGRQVQVVAVFAREANVVVRRKVGAVDGGVHVALPRLQVVVGGADQTGVIDSRQLLAIAARVGVALSVLQVEASFAR